MQVTLLVIVALLPRKLDGSLNSQLFCHVTTEIILLSTVIVDRRRCGLPDKPFVGRCCCLPTHAKHRRRTLGSVVDVTLNYP